MDKLAEGLTLEMLPEGLYRMIAEAIGTDNFYKLAEVVGGTTVYIPKPESVTRPVRDARIKEEFNGYNHPELARRHRAMGSPYLRPRADGGAARHLRLSQRPGAGGRRAPLMSGNS